MKKVLLLGDSIRMGYAEQVRALLAPTCDVYHDEQDNGRFAAYTLWQANQLIQRHGPFDAVHWNNGYWDMHPEAPMQTPIHPLDEYVHFLGRILCELRRACARIIFATTTPVLDRCGDVTAFGADDAFHYRNEWVISYNMAATALMHQEGIPVNDLYTRMLQDPHLYKCADRIHLTEEGYRVCAEQVAACIREALAKP